MNQEVKDYAEVAAWLVAAIGGVVAAFKAVSESQQANVERARALEESQRQFRWRQAELARTVLGQLWADPLAHSAMRMLDWSGLSYRHYGRTTSPISYELLTKSLRTTSTQFDADEQFVRDCFDQLFDHFEGFEHYLSINLVAWEDIRGRCEYYVGLLSHRKAVVEPFLMAYGFALASRYLQRFSSWGTAKVPHPLLPERQGVSSP
jgi:hypothetical protein